MPTVTLFTHCHSRDLKRLHDSLDKLIESHRYNFDRVMVVHQRCPGAEYEVKKGIEILEVNTDDYEWILAKFGIPHLDPALSEITHGWSWQWYYEHHCVNHCAEILASTTDYLVFNDADCYIKSQPNSWVEKGISLLENFPEIFVVSPSDGGHEFSKMMDEGTRLTQTMSQQMFMGRGKQFRELDFTNLQWDGKFIEGGPFQEFYGLFEGWLYRYMKANNLYRAILPEQWRYWHGEWH